MNILFYITIILEFITVPIFLHYYWPGRSQKSFISKLICSVLFILCGFFAIQWSGNNTKYATCILWGLIFGAIGDLALHALKKTTIWSPVGVAAFLVGHIFYISAFDFAINEETAGGSALGKKAFIISLCILLAVILVYALIILRSKKLKGKEYMLVGLSVYGVVLMVMLAKAIEYAVTRFDNGWFDFTSVAELFEDPTSIMLVLGALLFAVSDLLLGYLIANTAAKLPTKRHHRIINIVTYYSAQLILASSVLMIPFELV